MSDEKHCDEQSLTVKNNGFLQSLETNSAVLEGNLARVPGQKMKSQEVIFPLSRVFSPEVLPSAENSLQKSLCLDMALE